jgi:uncharacterized SAM-binding protein YcdF (DUF218 family)
VRAGAFVLVPLLLWLGGFLRFVGDLPRAPAEPERDTDAIVVLTGGAQRLDAGIDLLRRGKAPRLLLSGVNASTTKAMLPSYAANSDLFDCCVELGFDAADTTGNGREVARWAAGIQATSLRVVTAGYHMPRALLELRRHAPALDLVPWPVSPAGGRVEDWWRAPATFALLAAEFTKYGAALLRSRLGTT